MVDYPNSSQLNAWLFQTPEELDACRAQANRRARTYLLEREQQLQNLVNAAAAATGDSAGAAAMPPPLPTLPPPPVECFARGYSRRVAQGQEKSALSENDGDDGVPQQTAKGHAFLTPQEEATLVSFYASKLPTLIGPNATLPRLRREPKVTATAALLLRRFFLSNSVMLFDPKSIMVAAAFLGSKVEDGMVDIRYLEEGTEQMSAAVSQAEIIASEVALLAGTHFDLLCFHPYKAVVALTEDLRTHLKTPAGQQLLLYP